MSPTQIELGNYSTSPSKDEPKGEAKTTNIVEFLKEIKTEFLKISWPSREQIAREFFSVLFLVFILTGIIFLIDKTFEFVVNIFGRRF